MSFDCQTCGACCRAPIVQIRTGKRGPGPCSALMGTIGDEVCCAIYEDRPSVCRDFEAGSMECRMLRLQAGLPVEDGFH